MPEAIALLVHARVSCDAGSLHVEAHEHLALFIAQALATDVGRVLNVEDEAKLEIHRHATGHVFARTSLGEESVEGIAAPINGLAPEHLATWVDAEREEEELPAGLAAPHARSAYMDAHCLEVEGIPVRHGRRPSRLPLLLLLLLLLRPLL